MPTRKRAALAKLTRPRLYDAVPRERLFSLLDDARGRQPLIWVSGPPGAGKTTLLAGYLESRRLPSLWYQLDRGDVDVAAFFHYLSLAAQQLKPRQLSLPTPSSDVMSDPIAFGRGFFRALLAHVPRGLMLVFDNYQEVPDAAVLHAVLRDAIEEIPENIHFVVLSRVLPSSVFARHCAHGAIAQIGFPELKLTLAETAAIARARNFTQPEAVRSIHAQTDGWFAGLTLLLEHATRVGQPTASTKSESLEAVFQYFAGEIFDTAAPERQQTLMQTAFLPVMTAKTAERISANPNAYRLLDWLHQRQLFVERRPGAEITYQYHALFREFLLSRAREIFTPVGLRQLARRAAALLQSSGLPEESVHLLLESEDWTSAKQAILALAPELFSSARWATLCSWISKLPETEVEHAPWLQFWHGSANLAQQPMLAQAQLSLAYAHFDRAGDKLGQILSCASVIRACHNNIHSEFPAVGVWIGRLVELLEEHSSVLAPTQSLDVHAALLAGFHHHEPANPFRDWCSARVLELLEDGSIGLEQKGFAAGMAIDYLVDVEAHAQIQRVVDVVRPALQKPAPERFTDLYLWHYYALYCQMIGDFAGARRHIDAVVSIAEGFGLRRLWVASLWFQHINATHDRDLAGLEAIREKLMPQGDEGKAVHLCVFHNVTASILLLRNDAAGAISHLESWRRAARMYNLKLHEMFALVALAATHYERYAVDQAADLAEEGRALAAGTCWLEEVRELTMVGALAADALGDRDRARAFLEEVFANGTPILWTLSVVPNSVPAKACALALKQGVAMAQARELIRRFRLSPPSPDLNHWPWPIRIQTLGEFVVSEADKPIRGGRKVQRKPLELLKALIALGGTNVDVQRLAEVGWPDLDGDAAMAAFHTALLRLRRLLGHEALLQLQDGKLSLDRTRCWVDSVALDHRCAAVERQAHGVDTGRAQALAQSLLELYRGDFLAKEVEKAWVLPERDRLRRRFLSCVAQLGQHLEAQQQWKEAIGLYQTALEAHSLAEDLYRGLMRCYLAEGRQAQATETYRRCRDLLSIVLDAKPSPETDALYRETRLHA